jgi:pseudouridine kinase
MGIVVIGATFVDIKGFPCDTYLPTGRNVGYVEYIHGGVARNLVEDIANVELRPTFISIVDDTPLGTDVLQKLINHKVNVDYVQRIPDGMGTWLAVFDNNGDVAGSISKRPNMLPVLKLLEERGDEIFSQADSAVIEVDIDKDIVKTVLDLCEKHGNKKAVFPLSMLLGTLICYLCGTAWYMIQAKCSVAMAFLTCIAPFISGDIIKIAAASIISISLRPRLSKILNKY